MKTGKSSTNILKRILANNERAGVGLTPYVISDTVLHTEADFGKVSYMQVLADTEIASLESNAKGNSFPTSLVAPTEIFIRPTSIQLTSGVVILYSETL